MNNKLQLSLVFLSSITLTACDDHTEGKPTATISEAVKTPAEPAAASPTDAPKDASATETLAINPANSSVEFTGAKVTGSHEGGFKNFTGTANIVPGELSQSSVELTIQTNSIFTDTEKLTGHLKSADFFNVEKIPTATFKSTKIAATRQDGFTHELTGDLTLHGVTKSIRFPANVQLAGDKFNAKSEFVINRQDFGIKYPGMPDDLIKDDIVIKLSLALPRSKNEG